MNQIWKLQKLIWMLKKKKKATLSSAHSKQKIATLDKTIKTLKTKTEELTKTKDYSFEVMLKPWAESGCATRHLDITRILNLAALIPLSTVKVKRTFSLMKLICKKLRNRLSQENLGACIRIWKFRELTEKGFHSIMEKWLKADDKKSKKSIDPIRLSKYLNLHFLLFSLFTCVFSFS